MRHKNDGIGGIAFLSNDEFISEKEAAQILGVNPRTVSRYADQGRLARYKQFGLRVRYKRSEIENFAKPIPDVNLDAEDDKTE